MKHYFQNTFMISKLIIFSAFSLITMNAPFLWDSSAFSQSRLQCIKTQNLSSIRKGDFYQDSIINLQDALPIWNTLTQNIVHFPIPSEAGIDNDSHRGINDLVLVLQYACGDRKDEITTDLILDIQIQHTNPGYRFTFKLKNIDVNTISSFIIQGSGIKDIQEVQPGCYQALSNIQPSIGQTYDIEIHYSNQTLEKRKYEVQKVSPALPLPNEEDIQARLSGIDILSSGITIENYYTGSLRAYQIRIGPNNELLFLGDKKNIYRLYPTGEIHLFASLGDKVGGSIRSFAFAPNGKLWFTTFSQKLYFVNTDGTITELESPLSTPFSFGGNDIAFNSEGILYTLDSTGTKLMTISAQGEQTVFGEDFGRAQNLAISPDDRVLIVERTKGELLVFGTTGIPQTLAAGLSLDHSVTVSPDGTVYLFFWTGLSRVDLTTGEVIAETWYQPFINTGEYAVFNEEGKMYTYHPNVPIYSYDIDQQFGEVLYHPRTMTNAMAVGPDSRVFVAYGDMIPNGKTTLYEVSKNHSLSPVAEFPYKEPISMTFNKDGIGYITLLGEATGTTPSGSDAGIYSFNPNTGETIQITTAAGVQSGISIDPTDQSLWWFSPKNLKRKTPDGVEENISFPVENLSFQYGNGQLAFDPFGNLYALVLIPAENGPF